MPGGFSCSHRWQLGSLTASQGKRPQQILEQLLCTFNYDLNWKIEDPSVLFNYVLYLAWSPEFYLIMHYVGTKANRCFFVHLLSSSAVSRFSRGEAMKWVANVNGHGRLLNIAARREGAAW